MLGKRERLAGPRIQSKFGIEGVHNVVDDLIHRHTGLHFFVGGMIGIDSIQRTGREGSQRREMPLSQDGGFVVRCRNSIGNISSESHKKKFMQASGAV
jgi:hypothetical protein